MANSGLRGGRFDATPGDEYPFLYAAGDDCTTVAEVLLRDIPIDERGARLLPRASLARRRIGWLRTTRDLELISLRSGKDLAAVGQDTWLTASDASDYAMTRRWCSATRNWSPWAEGLTWRSHQEPEGYAYVFFGDRCPAGCFEEVEGGPLPVPPDNRSLSDGAGRVYVEEILTSYRVALT